MSSGSILDMILHSKQDNNGIQKQKKLQSKAVQPTIIVQHFSKDIQNETVSMSSTLVPNTPEGTPATPTSISSRSARRKKQESPVDDTEVEDGSLEDCEESTARDRKVNFACSECRKAHKACSGGRPCDRCKKLGIDDKCHSTVRKKRILTKKYWYNFLSAQLEQQQQKKSPTMPHGGIVSASSTPVPHAMVSPQVSAQQQLFVQQQSLHGLDFSQMSHVSSKPSSPPLPGNSFSQLLAQQSPQNSDFYNASIQQALVQRLLLQQQHQQQQQQSQAMSQHVSNFESPFTQMMQHKQQPAAFQQTTTYINMPQASAVYQQQQMIQDMQMRQQQLIQQQQQQQASAASSASQLPSLRELAIKGEL